MELNQSLIPARDKNVSETTILVFSFVTALIVGIIIISAVFITVRKIESSLTSSLDVTYSASK